VFLVRFSTLKVPPWLQLACFQGRKRDASQDGSLRGRLVLIVQGRWLIARQLSTAFKAQGARVLLAHNATAGELAADAPDLAAAVLNSRSGPLCGVLRERGVPFVMYTAHEQLGAECAGAPLVRKPAKDDEVVRTIRRLL